MSSPAVNPTTSEVPINSASSSAPQISNTAPSSQPAPSSAPQPSSSAPPASSSAPPASSAPAPSSSASQPPASSAPQPSTLQTSSAQSSAPIPTTSAVQTSAAVPTTSAPTTSAPNSSSDEVTSYVTTVISTNPGTTETSVVVVVSTRTASGADNTQSSTSTSSPGLSPNNSSGNGGSGLKTEAKVAIGVVVPIAAIALLAIAALFFWKKRKARLAAEEERRKEVEDYAYNPNADPTIPGVADGGYEMREDTSGGYRGWGTTTLASSTGRKASTTMSGSRNTYSDPSSPTHPPAGMARSDKVYSPDGEILGAMSQNPNGHHGAGVDRGPSNASSSYSAANRSDASDLHPGVSYGQGATYYDVQDQEMFADGGHYQDAPGTPVIRDNPARRNARIEKTSHYPQQSAGISQNF